MNATVAPFASVRRMWALPNRPLLPCPMCHRAGCTEHTRHQHYDAQRQLAAARGYDRQWRNVRAGLLPTEPLCRRCYSMGIIKVSEVMDHIVPLRAGGERLLPSNLQGLCRKCNSIKAHDEKNGIYREYPPVQYGGGRQDSLG